jgi:predicted transcriptional regulator
MSVYETIRVVLPHKLGLTAAMMTLVLALKINRGSLNITRLILITNGTFNNLKPYLHVLEGEGIIRIERLPPKEGTKSHVRVQLTTKGFEAAILAEKCVAMFPPSLVEKAWRGMKLPNDHRQEIITEKAEQE